MEQEIAFGKESERKNLAALQTVVPDIVPISSRYFLFDYSSSTAFVELKTRKFKKDKYPTTIVGLNKIDYAKANPGMDYYFAFCFEDGLYYIKYDKELFETFQVTECYRRDRGVKHKVVNICVDLLRPVATSQ